MFADGGEGRHGITLGIRISTVRQREMDRRFSFPAGLPVTARVLSINVPRLPLPPLSLSHRPDTFREK